jgi:hypothetical protein
MSPGQRCDEILRIIDEVLCKPTGLPASARAGCAPALAGRRTRPKDGLSDGCLTIGVARWTNDDRDD